MNTTAENYNAIANHNLSSVLSQIQDNGPAYAESMVRQNTRSTPPQSRASNKADNDLYGDDTISLSSTGPQEKQQYNSTSAVTAKKEISPGVWLQLLLLLISAALLASTLFKLDTQSKDIENSLTVYDENINEKIQESVDQLIIKSSSGSTEIQTTLQSLQDELKLIKTDYSTLDKKYVALAESTAAENGKLTASLQKEILSLKTELQAVNNTLETAGRKNIAMAKTAINNGLTVNLASLRNKSKAEKIIQQLYAEGLVPNITPAMVRGERVYRLSVSGFVNREEAESFIRKVDKKYGMKGSRIRKS